MLTKPNGGKADALNYALDTSTKRSMSASMRTGCSHTTPSPAGVPLRQSAIRAVAGNAKVGNRVNLWTRWQALEYITSQNFERRALDLFDVVMVVPGAIGAWRTDAVKGGHGYPHEHGGRRCRSDDEFAGAGLFGDL